MDFFEKKISSKTIYSGKVLTLQVDDVKLPNGNTASREVVRHNGGVSVVAIDEDKNLLLVRQYRYPYGENLLEIPAGKLEKGEDPELCGIRELREETGYEAGNFKFLAEFYPTPGYTDERLYIFTAENLTYKGQKLDADEFLSVQRIPLEKAVEMCFNGEIKDAKSVIGILMYNKNNS
ncbi:MAG: NUDIX hydrolase [Oscillospiraceae bacterium]|nr:NUDIX hydrolase [Oscillospiraceae bacterium]